MSSRDGFPVQSMDYLIMDALRAQVEGVEPSPRVWARICRRARARAVRRRPRPAWNWNGKPARMPEADVALPLPVVIQGGLITWRYDLAALRFLDYAGMMFRFGW